MSSSSKFGPWIVVSGAALLFFATSLEAIAQRVPQPAVPANPRQANPNAPANPRGAANGPETPVPANARGAGRTAANNAATIVGQVVAYEADKSITIEVKRRGNQTSQSEFNLIKDKSKIEFLGETKEISKGTTVSLWADKDDAKIAARIVAGTPLAAVRGQTNPANPGRGRQDNPAKPGNVRTPNPNGAAPNLRGQSNPANPSPRGQANPDNPNPRN